MNSVKRLANNYSPLPVVIRRAKDIYMWDINNKKYVDLLAGYSAVNQGHCHPNLVLAMQNEVQKLTLTSRVVQSENLIKWAEHITGIFKYDQVLAMNSGAEAVETALKLARRYGSQFTKNPKIACLTGNFHGRTMGAISLSDYTTYKEGFGPLLKNIIQIPMNNPNALYHTFEKNKDIVALIYEPIQGEGGINPISKEFFDAMYEIKNNNHNLLLMSDEIQSGLGRVGDLTAGQVMYNKIKPDVLILGKALSGGMIPMSCVLANEPMNVFNPGSHGSTYGGNPLACAISIEALNIIEKVCIHNVLKNQNHMENRLKQLPNVQVRGAGMFWGIQFDKHYNLEALRLRLLDKGYITCTSRSNTLRLTPPLTISKEMINQSIDAIENNI